MPSINIYLPDDLYTEWKENQEKCKAERIDTSPICQKAIREELDRRKQTNV